MKKILSVFRLFGVLAMLFSLLALNEQRAFASGSCAGAGYLCFYDYGSAQYGNVSGNNSNWSTFGWNDRADWFYNQGNHCSVRVYKHSGGGGGGYSIPRGGTLKWYNIVSSNYWC